MPDPFEALRMPLTPVDPDRAFAAQLRARIELELQGGPPMTRTAEPLVSTTEASATPALVPYLAVSDARKAIDWYVDVLGARWRGDPIVMPDGRLGHSELALSGSVLYLADEFPEINFLAPATGGASSVSLTLLVGNVDRVAERAVAAGAVLERAPADQPYGRMASILDPFGHRWQLQQPLPVSRTGRHGDVAYMSLWVPDAERATQFFEGVFGAPLRHRIYGDQPQPTLFCSYFVDDVDHAVERVRAGGGTAREPEDSPYGRLAECTDPDGQQFALVARGAAPNVSPDVSYLTMVVRDSTRARDFYGSVLGWRFTPGRVQDGWNVEDVVPMTGLAGGAERSAIWPMYSVRDIHAAVDRVRAQGGTASDVSSQPYGLMSECTDDQGTHFYLGQHAS